MKLLLTLANFFMAKEIIRNPLTKLIKTDYLKNWKIMLKLKAIITEGKIQLSSRVRV